MVDRLGAALAAAVILAGTPCAAEPIILRFAPGATTLRTQGRMSPAVHQQRYSLDLRKGQTVTMNFEGAGPLVGEIDGDGEGPLAGYGDTYVVPKSGPCILTIEIGRMAERWTGAYHLDVTAE